MKIIVVDPSDTGGVEATAMVQALYSRSPKSVVEHLEKVREVGASSFMGTYYVGYGHKSIGDCGSTTVCIEGCSMLAAKAIQDWPLYSGQEASTRYMDMGNAEFLNPLETDDGERIQRKWREIYEHVYEQIRLRLASQYPRKEDESEAVWTKAINARAFDVARGFLPAGCLTYVSWHSNLRQLADHIRGLLHHPLGEVRDIGRMVLEELKMKYPSSFKYEKKNDWMFADQSLFAFESPPSVSNFAYTNRFDMEQINRYLPHINNRPKGCELHHRLRSAGSIVFTFPLDFGSYRDLQRQRSCVQDMPLLGTEWVFHPWYREQTAGMDIDTVLCEQEALINRIDPLERQYYTAMGYNVPCKITCSLPSAVYIAELRTQQTVHPTLRRVAQQMAEVLMDIGIKGHWDMSPDAWSLKRGRQDIVAK